MNPQGFSLDPEGTRRHSNSWNAMNPHEHGAQSRKDFSYREIMSAMHPKTAGEILAHKEKFSLTSQRSFHTKTRLPDNTPAPPNPKTAGDLFATHMSRSGSSLRKNF